MDPGLRDFGYFEGQNISIEWRLANGQMQLLPAMAEDLAKLNVDVIVAATGLAGLLAQKATKTIPIVVISSHDGVGLGLYQSVAYPGGNITGIDSLSEALDGKRIEILRQLVPKLSRLTILYNPDSPDVKPHFVSVDNGAKQFGIDVQAVEMRSRDDLQPAFDAILRNRPDAVISILDALLAAHREKIVAFALENKLPMCNEAKEFVELGQLFSYGANLNAIWRRGAYYVDRILKGAKPGDLPVETPTVFELAINRKTATALGLTVPDSLIATADIVIG